MFVDSNIPMYVASAEHPNRGPETRFLESAADCGFELCTSTEVLQKILYRVLLASSLFGCQITDPDATLTA